MAKCLALADLGASINLMQLYVWNKLSLPDLSLTCMTLELVNRLISQLVGVTEDVFIKVGTFHFSTDFVVVDFDADPRVPLILGRSFLKTGRSLIDVFEEVELKDLPPHLEYTFLEGNNKLPVIIAKDLSVEEKTALITVLKANKGAISWKLSDIKGIDLEFCTHKILMEEDFEPADGFTVVEKEENELIPTRLVMGWRLYIDYQCVESFQTLKRKLTEAPILIALEWDMPFELMCDASDFAIGAVLGQRQEKHFSPIHYVSKTMTKAETNYSTTEKEMLAVGYAFEFFWSYLIINKSIVYTDHSALKYLLAKNDSKVRLLHWVLLLQEFTFKVIDTKRAENLATDHLSRQESPHQNVFNPKEINDSFLLKTLNLVSTRGNSSTPWFADFANYYMGNFVVKGMLS
nr:reverse transcriptase domain-containing protein [Tanacetum cinerariifolium]